MKIPLRLAVAVALLATAMIGTVSAATLYGRDGTLCPLASLRTARKVAPCKKGGKRLHERLHNRVGDQ